MTSVTLKDGESVRVGDDVVITFLARKGNRVKLGVEAPHEASIHRDGWIPPGSEESDRGPSPSA